jgi:capsular polysaccharide biosynthesis protein
MAIVEGGNVKILDEPEYPQLPSSPNLVRNVEIGVFAGLLISLVLVFAIEMLDNKVKDAETIAESFKYPVLGEVPYFTTNAKEKKQKKSKVKNKKESN